MNYREEKIKKYLIGGLNEPDADEIDLQIFSGELSEETLLVAENDLVEDYLENNLSAAELVLFQKNFLTSKARKRQIYQISLLKNYAEHSVLIRENESSENESGFFWRLANLHSLMPFRVAFGIVVVSIFIGLFWYVAFKDSPDGSFSPLEQEYAALNKDDLSDLGKFQDVSKISLVSGSLRGAGESNNLSEGNLTDKVLVRLALPDGIDTTQSFRVEFMNGDENIFTQTVNRYYQNSHGEEIRLFVPSKILQKGDYKISVKKQTTDNSVFKYGFSIN